MAATAASPMTATASSLGGYDFAADPSLGWRSANVFWRPEVAADVVSFVPSPAKFNGGPTVADLCRFAVVQRKGADGLHVLWDDGTQLWVIGDAQSEQQFVALLPFNGTAVRRAIAAAHVWSRIAGARARPSVRMTVQATDRFALRLRALDGLRDGVSRRQIAIGLFGADCAPAGAAWKSSEIRSRIYRLVDDSLTLSRGGYLNLLR